MDTGEDRTDADGRSSGWYPDPRDTGRERHWDGERWSGLSRAAAAGDTDASPELDPHHEGSGRRTPLLIAGAALLVAVIALGAWALLRGGGDDTVAAPGDTTTSTVDDATTSDPPESGSDPTVTTDPGDGAPDAPAPGAGDPDSGDPDSGDPGSGDPGPPTTAPLPSVDPVAPCTADADKLLGLAKAHPPLASFAAGLRIAEVKCAGRWATGVISTADTDNALAVFERTGDGFTLLLVGSAEPCAGLGIPAESEPLLGCNFIG